MAANVKEYPNLIAALEDAPGERPFVTHWIDEDECETVTFAEFRRQAASQGRQLAEEGCSAGDRVVIIMPQSIAAMTTFVGAMMIGSIPAFLAYPNFKVEAQKYRSGLAGVTANLAARAVVIDEQFPEEFVQHVTLADTAKLIRAAQQSVSNLTPCEASPSDLAFIQHSAGTTGLQKGVALTHGAVLRQIGHLGDALRIREDDSIYSWLPLYHDMGLIACFMLPMVCHIPVVMQSPIEWVMQPEALLQAVTACKCTLGWMPNFAFQFVPRRVPRKRWAQYDLSSLRALINCSEPVRATSMQEFDTAFQQIGLKSGVLQASYAMAENVFSVTQTTGEAKQIWADGQRFRSQHQVEVVPCRTPGSISFTSSGKLLPGNDVRILSSDAAELRATQVGEILVRSDSLFTGYYNRPDLTADAFLDGWYRTGDLGFLLDGELFVVGRKKDLLIIGGENLYPQDIEAVVDAHPAIHDGRSIALGIFNPDLGTEDIVIAAEVATEEDLANADRIEQEIRQSVVASAGVAPRKIYLKPPKWIVKSTAGKPARSATREKLLREHPELSGDPNP